MPNILDFIHCGVSISPGATAEQAQRLFARAPGCDVLPVLEEGWAIGVLARHRLRAAQPHEIIDAWIDRSAPVFSMTDEPLKICRELARESDGLGGAFLVCDKGSCLGAGSLGSVLEGLSGPLAAQSSVRRQLLDLVSEELDTPLRSVLAMAECLERQPLTPDAQMQVRTIRDAGEALQRVVAAATELTCARHGLMTMEAGPVLLQDLIDDIQGRWDDRAARDGVNLLVSFDGDIGLSAMTDGARVRQVFDGLIEAALRRAAQGSIEVGLRATVEADGLHLEGRVRDTGHTLGPDRLARIFEAAGADAGGMGIALAREVVLGLNGCIRAEGNVGAGLTIVFDFVCPPAPCAAKSALHADLAGARAAHILVVDDNATNRMVAEALCEMFDCTSESAVDGVQAVEMARCRQFDAILMDIKMPRMDGMAATQAIRALPGPIGSVPIIALTANVDPEDARAYLACGMCSVVEKPIKPDRLLKAINDALATQRERESAAAAA